MTYSSFLTVIKDIYLQLSNLETQCVMSDTKITAFMLDVNFMILLVNQAPLFDFSYSVCAYDSYYFEIILSVLAQRLTFFCCKDLEYT